MILLDPSARPVIAHRGASGEFPENTLLAFDRALEQGADAFELDVRLTGDGVPVVIHDATLDRTTDRTGPVEAIGFAELQQANAGHGERIPSIEQVLERFPHTPLLIEVKEIRAALPLRRALERANAAGRALLGSFRRSALRPFDGGPWHRAAARREIAPFLIAARLGLPAWRGRYHAFSVPERSGRLSIVTRRFVSLARRMGMPVHVWTVNDPDQAVRLWTSGVAGVISNFPGRVRAVRTGGTAVGR